MSTPENPYLTPSGGGGSASGYFQGLFDQAVADTRGLAEFAKDGGTLRSQAIGGSEIPPAVGSQSVPDLGAEWTKAVDAVAADVESYARPSVDPTTGTSGRDPMSFMMSLGGGPMSTAIMLSPQIRAALNKTLDQFVTNFFDDPNAKNDPMAYMAVIQWLESMKSSGASFLPPSLGGIPVVGGSRLQAPIGGQVQTGRFNVFDMLIQVANQRLLTVGVDLDLHTGFYDANDNVVASDMLAIDNAEVNDGVLIMDNLYHSAIAHDGGASASAQPVNITNTKIPFGPPVYLRRIAPIAFVVVYDSVMKLYEDDTTTKKPSLPAGLRGANSMASLFTSALIPALSDRVAAPPTV